MLTSLGVDPCRRGQVARQRESRTPGFRPERSSHQLTWPGFRFRASGKFIVASIMLVIWSEALTRARDDFLCEARSADHASGILAAGEAVSRWCHHSASSHGTDLVSRSSGALMPWFRCIDGRRYATIPAWPERHRMLFYTVVWGKRELVNPEGGR